MNIQVLKGQSMLDLATGDVYHYANAKWNKRNIGLHKPSQPHWGQKTKYALHDDLHTIPRTNEKWVLCERIPAFDPHYVFAGVEGRDFVVPCQQVWAVHCE